MPRDARSFALGDIICSGQKKNNIRLERTNRSVSVLKTLNARSIIPSVAFPVHLRASRQNSRLKRGAVSYKGELHAIPLQQRIKGAAITTLSERRQSGVTLCNRVTQRHDRSLTAAAGTSSDSKGPFGGSCPHQRKGTIHRVRLLFDISACTHIKHGTLLGDGERVCFSLISTFPFHCRTGRCSSYTL